MFDFLLFSEFKDIKSGVEIESEKNIVITQTSEKNLQKRLENLESNFDILLNKKVTKHIVFCKI